MIRFRHEREAVLLRLRTDLFKAVRGGACLVSIRTLTHRGSDLLVRHQRLSYHSDTVVEGSTRQTNEILDTVTAQVITPPSCQFQNAANVHSQQSVNHTVRLTHRVSGSGPEKSTTTSADDLFAQYGVETSFDALQDVRLPIGHGNANPVAMANSAFGNLEHSISQHDYQSTQFDGMVQSGPSSLANPTSDYNFLWSDVYDFLPTALFDTDYSLTDLWTSDIVKIDGALNVPTLTNEPLQPNIPTPESRRSGNTIPGPQGLENIAYEIETPNTEKLPASDLGSHKAFDVPITSPPMSPWSISEPAYERMSTAIRSYESVIQADFSIPSKHTISRYIKGYFEGFHKHFPFLHEASTTMDNLAPELLLGLCGVGAFHRFEHQTGWELYYASKAIILDKLEKTAQSSIPRVPANSTRHENFGHNNTLQTLGTPSNASNLSRSSRVSSGERTQVWLQTIQAFVVLIAMASWADVAHTWEALSMSSQLAMLIRDAGVSEPDEIREGTEWLEWIRLEERRRTIFVAYILFNLHSIAFNVAPLLLNQEVSLCLPHCGSEWKAMTAAHFNHLRQMYGHDERSFEEALSDLLCGREIHTKGPLSAFGNYVLMHGLVQQIFLERQSSAWHTKHSPSLRNDAAKIFESALQAWQLSWEATQESTLDPASPKGPLGFDAAALLRLGYIRVNADLGPHRNLLSGDSQCIADAVMDDTVSVFMRSPHIDRAVLQSIHALSIPIRTGINFVAYTQNIPWSIQNALCSLECAVLLCRWLCNLASFIQSSEFGSITQDERKLLSMVKSLIRESNLCQFEAYNETHVSDIRRMAVSVIRLWAETFKGVNVCKIADTIGLALSKAADNLEARLE